MLKLNLRLVLGSVVLLMMGAASAFAQSYTCNKAPCFKANPQGWIVGEIRGFAFGANGKDRMTKELLAQGWVECAGQTVPRAVPFDQLFRAIGDSWGSADGKFVFYLPDLRGSILRDWNHKSDAIQNHSHLLPQGIGVSQKAQFGNQTGGLYGAEPTGSTQGVQGATATTETRPRNAYVMYAIYVGTPVTITTNATNVQTLKALTK